MGEKESTKASGVRWGVNTAIAVVAMTAVFLMFSQPGCDRSGRKETCDHPGTDMRCWNGTVQICGGDAHWVDLKECAASGQQCFTTPDHCGDYTGSIACCD